MPQARRNNILWKLFVTSFGVTSSQAPFLSFQAITPKKPQNTKTKYYRVLFLAATLAQPCRSYKGGCSGETDTWCRNLRKPVKRTTLCPWEEPNRGSFIIDWCNQLAKAHKKHRRLEGCVAAGRNPVNRVVMAN